MIVSFIPVDNAWMESSTFRTHFVSVMRDLMEEELLSYLNTDLGAGQVLVDLFPSGDAVVVRSDDDRIKDLPKDEDGDIAIVKDAAAMALDRIGEALEEAKARDFNSRGGSVSLMQHLTSETPHINDWLV